MLQDLNNSITRYVRNNFMDGPRQDGFDVFLGTYLPSDSTFANIQLFIDQRPLVIQAIPYILAASVFMVLVALFTRRVPDAAAWPLRLFMIFWFVVAAYCFRFVHGHGMLYVSLSHKFDITRLTSLRSIGQSSTRLLPVLKVTRMPSSKQNLTLLLANGSPPDATNVVSAMPALFSSRRARPGLSEASVALSSLCFHILYTSRLHVLLPCFTTTGPSDLFSLTLHPSNSLIIFLIHFLCRLGCTFQLCAAGTVFRNYFIMPPMCLASQVDVMSSQHSQYPIIPLDFILRAVA
jgi:hypothetical protein